MQYTGQQIRIILAEDHTIVRQGLRSLLETQTDMTVVGEADHGKAAVALAQQFQPCVVIMDLGMPEQNGMDTIPQILQHSPHTKILVLTMHGGEEYVRPALRAGAHGYLLKGSDLSDIIRAIHTILSGHTFLSPSIAPMLLQHPHLPPLSLPEHKLTQREREILQLIAEGYTSPQIAQRFDISPRTVDTHRNNIMQKLNIHNLAGLVKYAIRTGLTSTE